MKIERCYHVLAKHIQKARLDLGLTQSELSKKVGISRPALTNMLDGRQRIYLHHVLRFERVLKTDLLKKLKKGLDHA